MQRVLGVSKELHLAHIGRGSHHPSQEDGDVICSGLQEGGERRHHHRPHQPQLLPELGGQEPVRSPGHDIDTNEMKLTMKIRAEGRGPQEAGGENVEKSSSVGETSADLRKKEEADEDKDMMKKEDMKKRMKKTTVRKTFNPMKKINLKSDTCTSKSVGITDLWEENSGDCVEQGATVSSSSLVSVSSSSPSSTVLTSCAPAPPVRRKFVPPSHSLVSTLCAQFDQRLPHSAAQFLGEDDGAVVGGTGETKGRAEILDEIGQQLNF